MDTSRDNVQLAQPALIPRDRINSDDQVHSNLDHGLFITFEGGEGTGKTTQSMRLHRRVLDLGLKAHLAREPGGTRLGEQIRGWVKREPATSVVADTLLFSAARAQLVNEVIRPLLLETSVVIVDRYSDSTLAYQGYGRGMDLDQIRALNRIATSDVGPHLTILLDGDPEFALGRVEITSELHGDDPNGTAGGTRAGDEADQRRYEKEPIAFHRKVRDGYLQLARERGRWAVIRANQPQHRIADAIWKRVRPMLIARGADPSILTRVQGQKSR